MKIAFSLLTMLSASMVAAAPHPFVVTDVAAALGSENMGVTVPGLDKRQQGSVYGFRKRTLDLRNALLVARGGQRANEIFGAEDAQELTAEDDPAAGDEQAVGEGKNKSKTESIPAPLATPPPPPPPAPGNATEPAGKGKGKGEAKGKGKGKGAAEDADAGQEYQLLGDQQAQQGQQQQQADQKV